jgi:hypothetical protein
MSQVTECPEEEEKTPAGLNLSDNLNSDEKEKEPKVL